MVFSWRRVLRSLMRVLLSLVSFVLAVALLSFLLSIRGGLGDPPDPKGTLQVFSYLSVMMLWFGWRGLVFVLPAVLFFTDLRAWRFWALLAIGIAIGPIYFCLLQASEAHWHFRFQAIDLLVAMPISGLSTLIYLLLLRPAQRRERA
jgi:hypothetical protein